MMIGILACLQKPCLIHGFITCGFDQVLSNSNNKCFQIKRNLKSKMFEFSYVYLATQRPWRSSQSCYSQLCLNCYVISALNFVKSLLSKKQGECV
jgi:hypothetical protein